MRSSIFPASLGAVALLGMATIAHGSFTLYSDQATFLSAVGAVPVETFDDDPLGDFVTLDVGPFTIDASKANDADINTGSTFGNLNGTQFFTGFVSQDNATTGAVTSQLFFIFDTPTTAFGAFFNNPGSGAGVALEVGTERVISLTPIGSGRAFVGFTSSTPFSVLSLVRSGDTSVLGEIFYVDDVHYNAIPEPGAATLAAGAALLAGLRRRR